MFLMSKFIYIFTFYQLLKHAHNFPVDDEPLDNQGNEFTPRLMFNRAISPASKDTASLLNNIDLIHPPENQKNASNREVNLWANLETDVASRNSPDIVPRNNFNNLPVDLFTPRDLDVPANPGSVASRIDLSAESALHAEVPFGGSEDLVLTRGLDDAPVDPDLVASRINLPENVSDLIPRSSLDAVFENDSNFEENLPVDRNLNLASAPQEHFIPEESDDVHVVATRASLDTVQQTNSEQLPLPRSGLDSFPEVSNPNLQKELDVQPPVASRDDLDTLVQGHVGGISPRINLAPSEIISEELAPRSGLDGVSSENEKVNHGIVAPRSSFDFNTVRCGVKPELISGNEGVAADVKIVPSNEVPVEPESIASRFDSSQNSKLGDSKLSGGSQRDVEVNVSADAMAPENRIVSGHSNLEDVSDNQDMALRIGLPLDQESISSIEENVRILRQLQPIEKTLDQILTLLPVNDNIGEIKRNKRNGREVPYYSNPRFNHFLSRRAVNYQQEEAGFGESMPNIQQVPSNLDQKSAFGSNLEVPQNRNEPSGLGNKRSDLNDLNAASKIEQRLQQDDAGFGESMPNIQQVPSNLDQESAFRSNLEVPQNRNEPSGLDNKRSDLNDLNAASKIEQRLQKEDAGFGESMPNIQQVPSNLDQESAFGSNLEVPQNRNEPSGLGNKRSDLNDSNAASKIEQRLQPLDNPVAANNYSQPIKTVNLNAPVQMNERLQPLNNSDLNVAPVEIVERLDDSNLNIDANPIENNKAMEQNFEPSPDKENEVRMQPLNPTLNSNLNSVTIADEPQIQERLQLDETSLKVIPLLGQNNQQQYYQNFDSNQEFNLREFN